MRRKLAHIVLILPLVLLFIHSITPHHHVSALNAGTSLKVNHQCPSSLLRDIFKFDPGVHHLEDYQISKLEVALNFVGIPVSEFSPQIFTNDVKLSTQEYVVLDEILPPKHFPERYYPLRAPPFMMG